MKENDIEIGKVNCGYCGQLLGFEKNVPWRKMKRVKCPICKKINWVMLDTTRNCLLRLAEYEESGMSPAQIVAVKVLYNEAKKYPELKVFMDKWERKLDEINEEKSYGKEVL